MADKSHCCGVLALPPRWGADAMSHRVTDVDRVVELFTDHWALALQVALHASAAYQRAASRWEGAVVLACSDAPSIGLTAEGGPLERGVYLDLWHGECRAARLAHAADYASARYVLSADAATWLLVLDGDLAPTMAILRGKIKLKRGTLGGLLPHVHAATALVVVAQGVDRHGAGDAQRVDADRRALLAPSAPAHAVSSEGLSASGVTRSLQSTSATGIRFNLLPMRLWEKAKRHGIWNPSDIDFAQDRVDWRTLKPDEQDVLLRLTSLFQAGEESVTLDILPLIDVIAQEGRLEEQLYLTSFLWEEAKHVEVFRRFFDNVAELSGDLTHFHSASYQRIFGEELPAAMGRLRTDRSPVAQARASVTYNMIVEGVLAETGYHVYHQILTARGIMPGMQRVAALLKADESRHLAYGIFLLSRLVVEHGDDVWRAIAVRMDELLPSAIEIINESFAAYPVDNRPFGLAPETFVQFAMTQFQRRYDRIERARRQSVADLHTLDELEVS